MSRFQPPQSKVRKNFMGLIPEFEDYQIVQVLFGNISLFWEGTKHQAIDVIN